MTATETIYALSSGSGKAGVAIVRVSGSKARDVCEVLCGKVPPAREASLVKVVAPSTDQFVDKALAVWFPAPGSFTGEDTVELHLHGSRGIVRIVLEELRLIEGLRPAQAGEFARRAFLNGKLDLVEIEGLADMLDAESRAQVQQALFHADGQASQVFSQWRTGIVDGLASLEATIDFSDQQDVAADAAKALTEKISAILENMTRHLSAFERGQRVRQGFRVVLLGAPNAGKSSLMNALSAREAAIVSQHAGTTRDIVEVGLDLGGFSVELSDTAGVREEFDSEVERIGVERALNRAEEADIVLFVGSTDAPWPKTAIDSQTIRIWNKTDLSDVAIPDDADFAVSAITGEGLDDLLRAVSGKVAGLAQSAEPALIVRERQLHAVQSCAEHLKAAIVAVVQSELAAEELRLAANDLEALIGRVDVEDLLDDIFSRFCVGK